jgi:hypothetical protein
MRLMSYSNHDRGFGLLALILATIVGQAAVADPWTPSKVRTIPIQSEPADQGTRSTPHTEFSKVHNLTVRARLPDEDRDASGRELSAAPIAGDVASGIDVSGADVKAVRTVPVKPESPIGATDPDHHHVQTMRIPAQSAPQNEIGAK